MKVKLNLIPPVRRFEISQANKLRFVLHWEVNLAFIVGVFIALLASLNYLLQINLQTQLSEVENKDKSRYERISELDSSFEKMNEQIYFDELIQSDQLYWSNMLKELGESLPRGIRAVKMANKDYKFLLAGTADTRDTLVSMKESLSQNDCFSEVNLPLSSLVSRENIDFQVEFNIKESCIKK